MEVKLRHLLLSALAACALVAAVYLPPQRPQWRPARLTRRAADMEAGMERLQEWLYVLELRDSLMANVREARQASQPTVELVMDSGIPTVKRQRFDELLSEHLQSLEDRDLHFSLLVALLWDTVPPVPDLPWWPQNKLVAFLPRATDGRTCVVALTYRTPDALEHSGRRFTSPLSLVADTAGAVLGLCAYYVAFGLPGPEIESWLKDARYEMASTASWLTGASQPEEKYGLWTYDPLVACAAGNRAMCRSGDIRGRVYGRAFSKLPGTVIYRGAWSSGPADLLLSDIVVAMGEESFERFWTSDASAEDAFAAEMGLSLDDWIMRWARARVGRGLLGSAAPPLAAAQALLIAGILLAVAVAYTARRQVR